MSEQRSRPAPAGLRASFAYALAGLHRFAVTDRNAWIHAIASVAAVVVGLWLELTMPEWRWVIAALAMVWLAEAFNTAIERLSDAVSIERNHNIRFAKDVAAGAVLVAIIAASLIAFTVFGPHLLVLFH